MKSILSRSNVKSESISKKTIFAIYFIGEKLYEVKAKVGHGNYKLFLNRIGFNYGTAYNYIKSYIMLRDFIVTKHSIEDLQNLKIIPKATYLLASRSTPDEVRTQVLEKARTVAISESEVKKFIAANKAKTPTKKAGAENEASGAKDPKASAPLVQKDERITDVNGGTTPIAPAGNAEIAIQQPDEIPPCQDHPLVYDAIIGEAAAPLEKQITPSDNQRDDVESEIADPAINLTEALRDAKEEIRNAIVHCAEKSKSLTPAQYIAMESSRPVAKVALTAGSRPRRMLAWRA